MKNSVLLYGTFAGLIMSAYLLSIVSLFPNKFTDPSVGMLIGYAGMLIGFVFIWVGIKKSRELNLGKWNYRRAFLTGLGIMAIASLFYMVSWLIYIYGINPQWMAEYIALEVERIQASGISPAEIKEKLDEIKSMEEMLQNPFFMGLFTFMEPLPPGILMTLIAAYVYRKKV